MEKRAGGEIIFRLTYQINATGAKERAEPVVQILADKKGWQSLAKVFEGMGKRRVTKKMIEQGDADDHQHVGMMFPGVNGKLSHRMELRLGLLRPKERAATLRKYGIENGDETGDLQSLFRVLMENGTGGDAG